MIRESSGKERDKNPFFFCVFPFLTFSGPVDIGAKERNISRMTEESNVNFDTDGYINESYYLNACLDIIQRGLEQRGIDPDKVTTNQMTYHFDECYKALFKPEKPLINNQTNNLPYNTINIERLINIYLSICSIYNLLPSVYVFTRFSGLTEETMEGYVTRGRLIIGKHRKNFVQNRLNDSPVGVIALANNDIDTGLLYTRQNIVAHATVKKALSFNDLKAIATGDIKSDD